MEVSIADPHTLVILGTYQCTAACRQCCFESSPSVTGRLSIAQVLDRIDEAHSSFNQLKLVVFSGGEAFLLKEDLFTAVRHATDLGLKTRIVTNGSWASTPAIAARLAAKLKRAGLSELNISTGLEHQEWVPVDSVVRAALALVAEQIPALITVEADTESSDCLINLATDPRFTLARADGRFLQIQSNSWMPFHKGVTARKSRIDLDTLRVGCNQIFSTAVITPHDNLSACCGLTLEHIPEMRLGKNSGTNMKDMYSTQVNDFLKYWISVDGPYSIIEQSMGSEADDILGNVVHPCQACAILHQNEVVKEAVRLKHVSVSSSVMTRFAAKVVASKSSSE